MRIDTLLEPMPCNCEPGNKCAVCEAKEELAELRAQAFVDADMEPEGKAQWKPLADTTPLTRATDHIADQTLRVVVRQMHTETDNALKTETQMKRYEQHIVTRCGEPWQELHEDTAGDWVRYDDVISLLARTHALNTELCRYHDAALARADKAESERDTALGELARLREGIARLIAGALEPGWGKVFVPDLAALLAFHEEHRRDER